MSFLENFQAGTEPNKDVAFLGETELQRKRQRYVTDELGLDERSAIAILTERGNFAKTPITTTSIDRVDAMLTNSEQRIFSAFVNLPEWSETDHFPRRSGLVQPTGEGTGIIRGRQGKKIECRGQGDRDALYGHDNTDRS
jgi:hypothetical protein